MTEWTQLEMAMEMHRVQYERANRLDAERDRAVKRLTRVHRIASSAYFGASDRKRALHEIAAIAADGSEVSA